MLAEPSTDYHRRADSGTVDVVLPATMIATGNQARRATIHS